MYHRLKALLLNSRLKKIVLRYEFLVRKAGYLMFYRGDKYYCNLCGNSLKAFIDGKPNEDFICPACGSLSRTRILWDYLKKNGIETGAEKKRVLHFSPHRYLRRKLKSIPALIYTDSDYLSDDCTEKYDICDIAEEKDTFDMIICYHILEHIKPDVKAMSELYRVLKKDGRLLVQVPLAERFSEEETGEEKTKAERAALYGQDDHVRWYTEPVLRERLTAAGFRVEKIHHQQAMPDREKVKANADDVIFKCEK